MIQMFSSWENDPDVCKGEDDPDVCRVENDPEV